MAYIRKRSDTAYECRIVNKLLPKPYYSTHDDEESARAYGRRLEAMLKTGQVPQELLATREDTKTPITWVLRDYLNQAALAPSDRLLVEHLQENLSFHVEALAVKWVDEWVRSMKLEHKLAPGTIRKKVECLARAVDWWNRKEHDGDTLPSNPLRTLPKGYSTYGESDGARVLDTHRDRRLEPGEAERIEAVILGGQSEVGRAKDLPHRAAFLLLFRLIVNTGLRLREAYSLPTAAVQLPLRTIHVGKSKTGAKRDVPLTPQTYAWVTGYQPTGAVFFPFWNGEAAELDRVTGTLSMRFKRVFAAAGCANLTEHDLRHEAVCRWVLMRDRQGRWMFRTDEIRKITGHKTQAQFDRYMSLRGSDLADRLWEGD